MRRTLVPLLLALLTTPACGEMHAATAGSAAPSSREEVAVTSIIAGDHGTRIVAYAFSMVAMAKFMRQLEQAGAKLQLGEIRPLTACGRRIVRAEFAIDEAATRLTETSAEDIAALFECRPN